MLEAQHTEFDLKIIPVGEFPYVKTIMFNNMVMDTEQVDTFISWGGEGNYIIKDAVNSSKYNMLDNYEITRCENLTDSDLGIRWALENSKRIEKKRKLSIKEQWKDLGSHGWLDTKGEFYNVSGFHLDFADDYIYDNDLTEQYRIFHKNNDYRPLSSEYLESIGWVRIQGSYDRQYVKNAYFHTINNIQMKKLTLICMKYNSDFKEVIENSEWDWEFQKRIRKENIL